MTAELPQQANPVIVVHTDDGNGLTACTGQPMPGPAGDVYRNVPRYFCQACAAEPERKMNDERET